MAKSLISVLKWGAVAAIALLMPRSTQRPLGGAHAVSERTGHVPIAVDQCLNDPFLDNPPCAERPEA